MDAPVSDTPTTQGSDYTLRISRLTIDKLGVKLYDRVSAVVAELVANAYDADATMVTVRLPFSTQLNLTTPDADDWTVVVQDDGHGLTPEEAQKHYLLVGADRRLPGGAGARSRHKQRRVMGRKGIGKLAPFGICRTIEVCSSGGDKTERGYLTSHFFIDFDNITSDSTDAPVPLRTGPLDKSYQPSAGTTIRLSTFLPKRVPSQETFMRQLERRFALAATDFEVQVVDSREPDSDPVAMKKFSIETNPDTKIDVSLRPVSMPDGKTLTATGWVAMAKQSYRDEEMAGVRIYARGKIVATTRDFEQPAGYTGEFATRSYMVGEVHADWLDDDNGEDLVRTDRQSILWESDLGQALRAWGAELTKEIGRQSRGPRREIVRRRFREVARVEERVRAAYGDDESIVRVALKLSDQIGGFAAEDELNDAEYVQGLLDVVLSVAPHQALVTAFQEFNAQVTGTDAPSLESLIDLFGKTRVAEAASYARIAADRVQVLDRLDRVIFDSARDEAALQRIITEAPWLIQPDWTVITANQSLKTFKTAFEHHLREHHALDVDLAIEYPAKRPDFILVSVGGRLHIVEIKASGHRLDDDDFERLYVYIDALKNFFEANRSMAMTFGRGWQIDLVVDGVRLNKGPNRRALETAELASEVVRMSWNDFRDRARRANEAFLEARDRGRSRPTDGVEKHG